jgi:hypothetical protein
MKHPYRSCKDRHLRDVLEHAHKQGWNVCVSRNNHLKVVSPEGRKFFCSSTPSDPRAALNFRAMLRKNGLKV